MSSARLRSLDVFRGATVLLMIGVNNPGSWAHLYPPLAHATWHGWTPTDLVFPFFLFAVGNALALVLPGLRGADGRLSAAAWARLARRTALIFAIGLLLNAWPFVRWSPEATLLLKDADTLRLMGVLQRIALAFGGAALVLGVAGRWGEAAVARVALVAAGALMAAYAAACWAWGAPGDPWSLAGWFGTAVDRAVLGAGHLYRGEGVPFDPEGLASTPPAIAQVLLGWWVGERLRRAERSAAAWPPALLGLVASAVGLLLAAHALEPWVPINKKIWTPSYVLLTTGLATVALVLLLRAFEAADGRTGTAPMPAWARVAEACGRNPLAIFVLSGLVPRTLALLRWPAEAAADGTARWTTPLAWLYEHGFAPLGAAVTADPRLGSLLYALAQVAAYGALALWMDRRRLYIRV